MVWLEALTPPYRVYKNRKPETRPEFFGFSDVWPEKPEILLSETWPDPNPKIRVWIFSRVFGYTMWTPYQHKRCEQLAAAHWVEWACARLQAHASTTTAAASASRSTLSSLLVRTEAAVWKFREISAAVHWASQPSTNGSSSSLIGRDRKRA